jgi:alpha-glucosidase
MIGRYRDADLNAEVARWAREQVGDGLLIAEYSHDFEQDVDGLGWHGVMNYAGFLRPVSWWLRGTTAESTAVDVFLRSPAPAYGGADAVSVLNAFRIAVPWDVVLQSWLPLDTHDTPRIRTVAGSRERQLVGVGLQMTSPGVPSVFAGSEFGIEGAWGQDARRTMPWSDGERDETLLDGYRRLIALRRSSGALAQGGIRYVYAGDDAIAYLRETRTERLLCLAARRPHAAVVVPFPDLETLYGEDARDGVLPASGPAFHVWRVPIVGKPRQ